MTGAARAAALVVLVLALRLPFLHQAIQGDEDIYLAEGAHALIDPLHPQDTPYVFQGREVDLRGHSHPRSTAGFSAACWPSSANRGRCRFMRVTLPSRWQPHWPCGRWRGDSHRNRSGQCCFFLAVPAFVVNGASLEADLPFLACWMAAIACFCAGQLAVAALALVAAALAAYQAVLLTPILIAYTWIFRRHDRKAWITTLVPVAALAGWQIFERVTRGAFPAAVLLRDTCISSRRR